MSVFHENMLIGASGQGAAGPTAGRSVRFNSADSAYLSRTPASAGNRKTWTWSGWVKRCSFTGNEAIFSAGTSNSNTTEIQFGYSSLNTISFVHYENAFVARLETTPVYRDPSAWMHIVIAVDTTLATANNRVRIYVNGSEVTTFDTRTNPPQNQDFQLNNSVSHSIGGLGTTTGYKLNAYLALVHLIDGQALTPSSFGETSATTGQWIAKTYSGSYGTNGFFLDFSDNSGATSTTLGKDKAGSNNWTPNNLSVTAGSGNDSLRDHPTSAGTSTGLGGEVSGNYAVWNPLDLGTAITLANGNLDFSRATGSDFWRCVRSTIGVTSGKWYWEVVSTGSGTYFMAGLGTAAAGLSNKYPGEEAFSYGYLNTDGQKYNNGAGSSYGATYANNDVIGVAFDATNGTLAFYKNGVSQGTAFTGLTSGPYFPMVGIYGVHAGVANFGQRAFAYTAPSGFSPLVDTLLPTPTIAKPNTVMDVVTYTGNGTNDRTITTALTTVGLAWVKSRNIVDNHRLADVVRGGNAYLMSNLTGAEGTATTVIRSFSGATFNLGTDSSVNTNNDTYVAWTWDAGSSNATNTSGTITSTVRANISAGFSVVTYTGNGSNSQTVGHGLGVQPHMVVIKSRSNANDWLVFHQKLPNTDYYLKLNSTAAQTSTANILDWNSSILNFITANANTNSNGYTYVAYCWAPVAGYSAFGSYTGDGSEGPFVYTGFRPRWVMLKKSSSTSYWYIYDAARDTYNAVRNQLYPNASDAEYGADVRLDFLSNGFKLRSGASDPNSSGTWIYACFAESPLPYARAR